MEPVKGKDVIIWFNITGEGFDEFGCAETMNVERSAELIESSTISTGVNKTFDYQSLQYVISLSSLVLNDDPKITTWDLWAQQENFLVIPYRMVFTDPSGTVKAILGRVLVQSINLEGSEEDLASSTIQLQGSGATLILDSIGEVELTIEVQADAGTASMSNIIITDGLGIETVVFAGTINQGGSQVVTIPAGTYHIRGTLTTNQAFALLISDAVPGFSQNISGPFTAVVYWPLPADSPIWDFTDDRFFKLHVSNVPIS